MKRIVLTGTLCVFIGIIAFFPTQSKKAPTTHEITLQADEFAFSPGRVKVNQGDTVIFTLEAMDVAHGFYLDGYEIEQEFFPGINETIELTADHAGKFRFRCSVTCGDLHPFMIGELEVRPNTPFVNAIKVSLSITIVAIIYLVNKPDRKQDVFWSS